MCVVRVRWPSVPIKAEDEDEEVDEDEDASEACFFLLEGGGAR
jgi:hypothetical protein